MPWPLPGSLSIGVGGDDGGGVDGAGGGGHSGVDGGDGRRRIKYNFFFFSV